MFIWLQNYVFSRYGKIAKFIIVPILFISINACNDGAFDSNEHEFDGGDEVPTTLIDHIQVTAISPPKGDINPGDQLAVGFPLQYIAIAHYQDNTENDITENVNWSSENDEIASIGSDGVALGKNVGSTDIYASFEGVKSNRSPLKITSANPVDIKITGRKATLIDLPVDYVATVFFDDQSQQDITKFVSWSSSNETVAMMEGSVATPNNYGVTSVIANYTASCLNISSNEIDLYVLSPDMLEPDDPYGLTLSPLTSTIVQGTSESYIAEMYINVKGDSGIEPIKPFNVTNHIQFTASDDEYVKLVHYKDDNAEDALRVIGIKPGKVNITGFTSVMGEEFSREAQLTITSAVVESLVVNCDETNIPGGLETQCHALATYSHDDDIDIPNSDVTNDAVWYSEFPDIATVDKGLVRAVGPPTDGMTNSQTVNIFASLSGVNSFVKINVTTEIITSLTIVTKENDLMDGGNDSLRVIAMGTTTNHEELVDISTRVSWQSEGENAYINVEGYLTVSNQTDEVHHATVTASVNSEVSGFLTDSHDFDIYPNALCGSYMGGTYDDVSDLNSCIDLLQPDWTLH